jgi:hypothetical protein
MQKGAAMRKARNRGNLNIKRAQIEQNTCFVKLAAV